MLSDFMPSYANGMSMVAGGMDEVLIAKPLKHLFIKLKGTDFYYHAVKRALDIYTGRIITSKIPLLPTLELLSKITDPPLQPLDEIHDKMVDLT